MSSTFGQKLRELREAAGLTQAELAERAGMNPFGVAKLEQGQREPSWATVLALAGALGLDCLAFQAPPTGDAEPRSPGRPPKAPTAERQARSGRGAAGGTSARKRPARGRGSKRKRS